MEWRRLSDSLVAGCALVIVLWVPAQAQYGGGSGTADDPYLICTPQQMNAIGADPNDWDKHFKLMADLDLSAYTGTEFNVIGHEKKAFTGVFDGNHHRIRKFTYRAEDANYVGLFGRVGFFSGRAELTTTIKDLGLIDPNVDAGGGEYIGALVGHFRDARILHCYVRGGYVSGRRYVGALIGGTVPEPMLSYTSSLEIGNCYATCSVSGDESVGGLVGFYGSSCAAPPSTQRSLLQPGWMMHRCYSAGRVEGRRLTGGLIGTGFVSLDASKIELDASKTEDNCLWDSEVSGQTESAGGTGLTTAEMMTAAPFLAVGWDFVGEVENGTEELWWIDEGTDYPRLSWEAADAEF